MCKPSCTVLLSVSMNQQDSAMSTCTHAVFVLSHATYHVVCCKMRQWANYANDNTIRVHHDFLTYNGSTVNLNVMKYIAAKF